MKPIDLAEYAEHSQKIPAQFLETKLSSQMNFKRSEIITMHFLDFIAIGQITIWFSIMLEMTLKSLMLTYTLKKAYVTTGDLALNFAIFNFIAFTYFAASYFFNQGQTPAMKMFKKRITMEEHSFEAASKWAVFSLSVYLSLGFSTKFFHDALKSEGLGSYAKEDHLYEELMSYKMWPAPALIENLQTHSVEEHFEEAA